MRAWTLAPLLLRASQINAAHCTAICMSIPVSVQSTKCPLARRSPHLNRARPLLVRLNNDEEITRPKTKPRADVTAMTPEELPPGRTSTGSSTEEPTASAPSQPTPPRKPPTPVPGVAPPGEDRPEFWRASGQRTLAELLAPTVPIVVDAPAKNVILFVGDGMGVSTVTASRIYGAQRKNGMPGEESRLAFERFPFTALIKASALSPGPN
ncbi:hypothetical protein HPB48_008667 [Haemaphysalis longicornis]|uniref:alkaline phosphatase n=1 Tax=Haemaphysalis longicornis TaxID=44386 RepID=A0A9J6GVA2_HAELO|nr:hypothetical protein HPB48_008667 [Haemaphysalis longicornis]